MSDDTEQSQKTEEPTEHRLEKAEEEGQLALSREVFHLFMLATFALLLVTWAPSALRSTTALLATFLDQTHAFGHDGLALRATLTDTLLQLLKTYGLMLLAFVVAAIAAGLLQTRFRVSSQSVTPKLSHLSPQKGLERLFGPKALGEFLKNILKFVSVGALTATFIWPTATFLNKLARDTVPEMMHDLKGQAVRLMIAFLSALFLIAGADFFWQRFMHRRSLRMTKQQIKDEYKELEGDPHIKQRLRQLRAERSRQRMMQDVPTATMVITNPTHFAVALKYELNAPGAPKVVAKGVDFMAFRIRDVAGQHDVPIFENPPLARGLYDAVEIGDEIPVEFYEAVAQIVRMVYKLDQHNRS
ncbi:MAG: flagellar biosynthesis protein FlhB [Holosporales bacterium]